MIKFFRRIRKQLLTENKFSKYLLYAIGEIVLVVVGILIALSINNLNEKRKQSNNIENILSVFEDELETNIKTCNDLIRHGYNVDSALTPYINNELTREGDLNKLRYLFFQTNTKKINDDNLDELIELEKQLSKKYIQLTPNLKKLKRQIESRRKWEKAVVDIVMSRQKELADELPFFNLRDSLSREKIINYILTNPIYKSKILHLNNYQLNENIWDATLIRTSSVALLWKIKSLREDAPTSIETFLKNLGLKPFQELECGEHPFEEKEPIFRRNFIIYNNTDKIVFTNFLNTEGEALNPKKIILQPKSFRLEEVDLGVNIFIEVLENDTCKKVYRRINEDYLIIN